MAHTHRSFIPAAGYDWLLPLYDPLHWLLRSDSMYRKLISAAELADGQRVLDIGCGTGSLSLLIKRLHPDVAVVGLDPDPKALDRAFRKTARAGVNVSFERGFSDALPYPAESFDRVFSTFMFHHLETNDKRDMLSEVSRVLRPEGSLHLLDFGGAKTRMGGPLAHLLHSSEPMHSQYGGGIPTLMHEMGLTDPSELFHRSTIFGGISAYRAGPAKTALPRA